MDLSSPPGLSDLEALEHFVVDNDDLLALEERIGRFNIFDALGIARAEIRHSNFLAWLLDPNESHGQGSLFLRAVLMDLLKRAGEAGLPRALSPVELDGVQLQGVEVRREWRGIDLLVLCKSPGFVVAIENKVDSGEHGDQLQRYEQTIAEQFPDSRPQLVFLTREGDPPDGEGDAALWVPYGYADLHRVLTRVRNANTAGIGDDVRAFLDHYLNLIGTRFMDDPTIDELCQRIYRNHRQALELVFDRVGMGAGRILAVAEEILREQGQWLIVKRTAQRLRFVPVEWLEVFPPIGQEAGVKKELWFNLVFRITSDRCIFFASVRPASDPQLRRRLIERLILKPEEFGFKTFFKNKEHIGSRYTALGREVIGKWQEDEAPDDEAMARIVHAKLDQLAQRLASAPAALQPLFDEWKANRGSES